MHWKLRLLGIAFAGGPAAAGCASSNGGATDAAVGDGSLADEPSVDPAASIAPCNANPDPCCLDPAGAECAQYTECDGDICCIDFTGAECLSIRCDGGDVCCRAPGSVACLEMRRDGGDAQARPTGDATLDTGLPEAGPSDASGGGDDHD
jgi:hypothetical protein